MRKNISTLLSGLKDRTSIKGPVRLPGTQAVPGPSDMADTVAPVKSLPAVHDRSPAQPHISKRVLASEASGSGSSPKVLTTGSKSLGPAFLWLLSLSDRLSPMRWHNGHWGVLPAEQPLEKKIPREPSGMRFHWLGWISCPVMSQSLEPEDGTFYIHLGPISM